MPTGNRARIAYLHCIKDDTNIDIICGSGTTLIQANELNMHATVVDVSAFNALISNVKIGKYNFTLLHREINRILKQLEKFTAKVLQKDF